jgi:HK97 family phage portal protein
MIEFNWKKFPFFFKRATMNMPQATLEDFFRTWDYESDAGVSVNPDTAYTLSAVYRAINLLSSTIGTLPIKLYRKNGTSRIEVDNLPGIKILNDPTQSSVQVIMRESIQTSALSWGNGYGYIKRNGNNQPLSIDFLDPQKVTPKIGTDKKVYYDIAGVDYNVPSRYIFHIPALCFNGITGKSPIEVARQSIGGGLAMQKYGNQFFRNGAKSSGVLTHPNQLSDNARERFRERFEKKLKGPEGGTMILEEGVKYTPLTIPNEQAQFLQSRKFTIEEIARWFGIPPHLLADLDRATYSNIEEQGIDFVTYSLTPWIVRWEQELNRKLLSPGERINHYFKFNLNGLLRGDAKTRAEYYRQMLDMGVLSINEVRQLEEFNDITDGDKHLVQLARTTLEKIGKDENA